MVSSEFTVYILPSGYLLWTGDRVGDLDLKLESQILRQNFRHSRLPDLSWVELSVFYFILF